MLKLDIESEAKGIIIPFTKDGSLALGRVSNDTAEWLLVSGASEVCYSTYWLNL